MALGWNRVTFAAVGAAYLVSTSFLAGVVVERVRSDRARVAVIRGHSERQRQARERVIRRELEQKAGRAVARDG
jgi:hypothetical protein